MSMLTPPGMGGKYRITGDAYPRMRRPRRRRRIVLAALAAAVALGLAGWGTLQLITVFGGGGHGAGAGRAQTAADPGCKPRKVPVTPVHVPLKPGQITVNVYNATPRAGLAKSTADELKKRGFAIGKVGNAPAAYDKKVPGPGLLLGGTGSAKGAFPVLGTQLKGATLKTDARATADVDLIIGAAFKALAPQKDASVALAALAKPTPAPSEKC
ncbi:LytR C-terminal domain-containing protein [Streptomyces ficellus]|uniref:LytR C-terminal domain-containing protein n=1 Tax=Streptomyces ficellus TaxID=1977088 RepID=A0ABT7ZD81_9ACTN|nr:LytR C-terminal domain-containing protein [Streptomyces ficellus]MDN3297470.1 LytR C-terminal domain-containing protein [Streptomyces ficellus]